MRRYGSAQNAPSDRPAEGQSTGSPAGGKECQTEKCFINLIWMAGKNSKKHGHSNHILNRFLGFPCFTSGILLKLETTVQE